MCHYEYPPYNILCGGRKGGLFGSGMRLVMSPDDASHALVIPLPSALDAVIAPFR